MVKNLKDYLIQLFFYIKRNQTCSSFTKHYSTSHHMHIHCVQILTGDRSSILHQQNEESRSFLFKNRIYPRIQLNMKAFSKRVTFKNLFFFKSNKSSQVVFAHLIRSNLRFRTRLSLLICSNLTHVLALCYPFSNFFRGYNPCLSTRLSSLTFFKLQAHVLALGNHYF